MLVVDSVMILNTLAEAIKHDDIVRLQLSLLAWVLLYCELSYETLYNEGSEPLLSSYIVELKIDNDLVRTNLRIAWQKIEFGITHIMEHSIVYAIYMNGGSFTLYFIIFID